MSEVTEILARVEAGDGAASDELFAVVYRGNARHSTFAIPEAYRRLSRGVGQGEGSPENIERQMQAELKKLEEKEARLKRESKEN